METYVRLTYFASTVGDQAKECESAFKGTESPLSDGNMDLYGLSVICVSIAQKLTV